MVKVIITSHAFSQAPGVQDKLAPLKESAAQNKQRLMHYGWTGILCVLSVFAMLLLSHVNASAQSLPSCAWRLESIGGSGSFNAFYPDTDASYWVMPVDTTQWKQVILQGQYPQSRFFSFTTYVAQGSTADGTYDINIDPDVGSSNPFRHGSSGQQGYYTVNVGGPSGQTNHVNFGNTRLAWIVYRIYVATQGLDPMAGVPLPAVTLVDANADRHSIAPCNTPRNQRINLLINDLRADGFDELADYWQTKFTEGDHAGRTPDLTCQPEDQVVFWIPQNTGGPFSLTRTSGTLLGQICVFTLESS